MSCPSSIRRQDSNPRPLERESTPITTRPGLPPIDGFFSVRQNFEPTLAKFYAAVGQIFIAENGQICIK